MLTCPREQRSATGTAASQCLLLASALSMPLPHALGLVLTPWPDDKMCNSERCSGKFSWVACQLLQLYMSLFLCSAYFVHALLHCYSPFSGRRFPTGMVGQRCTACRLMPIADELLGFQASLVMLVLGAAGAWCIHGTLSLMPVLTFMNLNFTAAWKCCRLLY